MTPDDKIRRAGLPADPVAYDSPRAHIARSKGLPTGYIPGGADPDPERGLREERRYGKLLLAMVIVLVLGGFVMGFVVLFLTGLTA